MNNTIAAIPNLLLASLPRKEYLKLLPDLSLVTLDYADVLYEPHTRMANVYFPDNCLVSLLTQIDRHLELEVGMVGSEGMVGTPLALGTEVSGVRALVQGGGNALRMSSARFLSALRRSPPFQRAVLGYVDTLIRQVSQTAACNRFHVVEARLARWLLMTRDRLKTGEFQLTHEFLSHMLGVRREGVSEAASIFQRQNLIEYSRGRIKILNHRGLEAASCSCYAKGATAIAPWRPANGSVRRQLPLPGAAILTARVKPVATKRRIVRATRAKPSV